MSLRPEDVWPVDDEYADLYERQVALGRTVASETSVVIVSIARNAMTRLPETMELVREVRAGFRDSRMFVFENDSDDGTGEYLESWRGDVVVQRETWGEPDTRGFERSRTERLARARNICHQWVRENAHDRYWTVVLDVDPEYGFSVDGVFNSVAWLSEMSGSARPLGAGGMASYSLFKVTNESGEVGIAHYDSWAARMNWWRDRRDEAGGMKWFSMLMPPVGSPPFALNSAFGGLAVYRTEAFLTGGYSGTDCEHVPHHRRMHAAGWQMYLNPGCRYIAIWR